MNSRTFFLLGLAALALTGCVRDPYIHGPFLIGATPSDYYPPECRPGDVRSHDVLNGWEKCMTGETIVAPVSEAMVSDASLPALQPQSKPRSAWD